MCCSVCLCHACGAICLAGLVLVPLRKLFWSMATRAACIHRSQAPLRENVYRGQSRDGTGGATVSRMLSPCHFSNRFGTPSRCLKLVNAAAAMCSFAKSTTRVRSPDCEFCTRNLTGPSSHLQRKRIDLYSKLCIISTTEMIIQHIRDAAAKD